MEEIFMKVEWFQLFCKFAPKWQDWVWLKTFVSTINFNEYIKQLPV